MRDLVRRNFLMVADLFRSRAATEAEILTLRQQIIVLRRTAPKIAEVGLGASLQICRNLLDEGLGATCPVYSSAPLAFRRDRLLSPYNYVSKIGYKKRFRINTAIR